MSADNGLLIWKDELGQYRLSEYDASCDYEREEDAYNRGSYSSLDAVVSAATDYMSENVVGYGVSFGRGIRA